MAGITCEEAQEQLAKWLEASEKIAQGIEVAFESGTERRRARMPDANQVQAMIAYWDNVVKRLCGANASRVSYVVPDRN